MTPQAIVFYLTSEWAQYHRPGLLKAVARAYKPFGPVIVVNNPVCRITARWHRPQRWAAWQSHPRSSVPLECVDDNLYLLDTAIPVHDKIATAVPGLAALNRAALRQQIGRALQHLGVQQVYTAWFQFPTSYHYVGVLREALAVYECYDEHSDIPGLSPRLKRRLQRMEQALLAAVDVVFVTSQPLLEARSPQHPRTLLTYNAADLAYFAPVAQATLQRVAERDLAHPVVGYLGTLHAHTDTALLTELATQRPGWQFVLIGPEHPGAAAQDMQRLKALPNVRLHGWVEPEALRELLCTIDVGIIPYRSDALFNRFVNPNKLHEYTAMGKPVVASVGLDLSSHTGRVVCASGVAEFLAGIETSHRNNSVQAVQDRLLFAQSNTWDVRAQRMLAYMAQTLADKKAPPTALTATASAARGGSPL